jgi:hypothetical protein
MADLFYVVQLARNEDIARHYPRGVEKWLIQLICEDHRNASEAIREALACEIAISFVERRWGSEQAATIGHKEVLHRYSGELSTKFGDATYIAPCGCRGWANLPL